MTRSILRAAIFLGALTASASSFAHTSEWYADHVGEAIKTQQSCLSRIKADGKLPADDLDECRRASDGVSLHHKFTASPHRTW